MRAGLRAWLWCQIRFGPRLFEPSAWACALPALAYPQVAWAVVPSLVSSTRGLRGQVAWVLYPVHSALRAPGCGCGNPCSVPQGSVPRVRHSPWVARLSLPWARGVPARLKSRSFWLMSSPGVSPLWGLLGHVFLLIDVVMSRSPGPGLSRVRRGTDIHGEWDRASRSARGSPAPPLLPPAVVGGVGGKGAGGGVGSGPTPLSHGSRLRAPVGVGPSDAADTLACHSWLPVG